MTRRAFLTGATGLSAAVLRPQASGLPASQARNKQPVSIHVHADKTLGVIPANFTGLGYEISSVATPGLLSANNRLYVQLVQTLGARGVIRVGGNTSDDASFSPNGPSFSAPKGTVINNSDIQELGSFLDATGWQLVWGLNLGSRNKENAVAEAQAVAAAAKDKLLAFEIGNEPDLFGRGKSSHRAVSYSYHDYLREYRNFKAAIHAKLPNAPFAGPDVASATDWVTQFAVDEGSDLKLLTHHYYRECASTSSTLDMLLHPDPKLAPELRQLQAASARSHVPYRICETNSFCGGGKPGVSDTFGAALWILDFMFTLAWGGAAGVNIETGVNQLGFISSYSPIGDNQHGSYTAKPDYYGMLAFAQASRGQRVRTNYQTSGLNVTAYAVLGADRRLLVTVINKEQSRDATVIISADRSYTTGNVIRLQAPFLEDKTAVTLGGSHVTASGEWAPSVSESITATNGVYSLSIAAGSAVIATLSM